MEQLTLFIFKANESFKEKEQRSCNIRYLGLSVTFSETLEDPSSLFNVYETKNTEKNIDKL